MPANLPRLARLFGVGLSDINETHILRLVSAGVTEGEDLEFKSAMYGSGSEEKAELAKDAAAFANRHGGLLLIGVAEEHGVASCPSPVEADDGTLLFLRSVLLDRVHPMLSFEIQLVPSQQEQGKSYVLIFISRSPLAPHAISKPSQEVLRYALRIGSQIHWLAESEVADLYRNRFAMASAQGDRLSALLTEGIPQLELSPSGNMQPWFILAMVPSLLGAMEVDARSPTRLAEWSYGRDQVWPLGGQAVPRVDAGVGIARIALREDYDRPSRKNRGFYAELHQSGSSFIAYRLPDWSDVPMDDEVLARVCAWLTDLAAAHAVENCGCFGDAIVEAQIVESERFEPTVSHSLRLGRTWGGSGVLEQLGPIVLDRGPSSRHTIDLGAAVGSVTELMVVTRMVLTDLVQAFGIPEPYQITRDGKIRISYFRPTDRREVAAAAGVIGVLTTDAAVAQR